MIKSSVAAVIKDGGFRLSSVPVSTTTALNTAIQLMEWMSKTDRQEELNVFAVEVMTRLRSCLPRSSATLRKAGREAMWRSYHHLRTSPSFRSLWREFVSKAVAVEPHPLLYQHVTSLAFQTLLEETYQSSNAQQAVVEALTYEESNALRYVAGYVCHKLRKKIRASTHEMRGKLLLCLMDLCDEDEEVSSSADWVHAVDRGGLVRVSESVYLLFERIKLLVRSVFNTDMVHRMTEAVRKDLHDTIITDEDVAFHWCMLTVEVEEAKGAVLLGMITDLYITIRGFSFSKSLMEMYKQEVKKCTQKSKSLRQKLATTDT